MDERLFHLGIEDRRRLVEAFASILASEPRVAFAMLFGSATERSQVRDIDVGIYLTPAALDFSGGNLWEFENALALKFEEAVRRATGAAIPVDVRVMNRAPVHVQYGALTGEIIHIADQDEFARVVEYAVPAYLDLKPLREQALRDVLSR